MQLIAHNGSVQQVDVPADVKELYKSVWEIRQRVVLDMAADRGAYIDRSPHARSCSSASTPTRTSEALLRRWT